MENNILENALPVIDDIKDFSDDANEELTNGKGDDE